MLLKKKVLLMLPKKNKDLKHLKKQELLLVQLHHLKKSLQLRFQRRKNLFHS